MTTVTFETATLADAVRKAAMVAPMKGHAFDKAAGIVFEVHPSESVQDIIVKATNLEIFMLQFVGVSHISGEDVDWRIPSYPLSAFVGSLAPTTGSTITVTQNKGRLELKCGKTKGTIPLIGSTQYPEWAPFDTDGMTEVKGLAKRMAEVSWACDKGNSPPLTGVHVDGDRLIATDKYRLATVECVVPVDQPVTVPLDAVAPILRMARDVQMSIYNGHLYLVPDDGTQIISICYEEKFPNWAAVARTDQECFLKLSAARLKEMLDRASVVIKNERFPKLIITLGNERLHMYLRSQEVEIEDELELDGQAIHPDIQIGMAPRNLSDALANSPNDQIEIWYFLNGSDKRPLRVAGGSGYTAWVMPRVDLPTPSGTSP